MNLVWHRDQLPVKTQVIDVEYNSQSLAPHWAAIILERLSQPANLADAIRLAFPQKIFPDIFEIFDIHHIPGRTLKILTRFQDSSLLNTFTIIHISFYSELDYLDEYNKAKEMTIAPDRISAIENWNAVVRIFPEDAGLPNLGEMLNLSQVAAYVGEPEFNENDASWRMLSYQVSTRCAFSYHFYKSGKKYFGKIQDEKGAVETHQRLKALWENPSRHFLMAQPIACAPQIGARWEAFVNGTNLEKTLETADLASIFTLIIRNLTYLHEQEIASLTLVSPDKIIALIQKKVIRRMHALTPNLAGRAEKILEDLNQHINFSTDAHVVTLHGDFHIANFLLNENGLFFLDLDNLSKGSPCYDLALFGSRLMLRNLLNNDRLPETLQLVTQLPALYSRLCGREISHRTFLWYLAAFLIARQIKVCMSNAAPNMEILTSKLLDWAEDCFSSADLTELNLR